MLSFAMPPIDLPPETPQEAFRLERLRHPAAVCPWVAPEHGERPHGGEPDVRTARFATAATSSASPWAAYHEPWSDSASNRIIEGFAIGLRPGIRITAIYYDRSESQRPREQGAV